LFAKPSLYGIGVPSPTMRFGAGVAIIFSKRIENDFKTLVVFPFQLKGIYLRCSPRPPSFKVAICDLKNSPSLSMSWFPSCVQARMSFSFILWFSFFTLAIHALIKGFREIPLRGRAAQGSGIRAAEGLFHELEETLASGVIPADEKWQKLAHLEAPWNRLSFDCLTMLRSEGAAVVPTLKRFRELARRHFESLGVARARSAQPIAQSGVCMALVPIFSFVLRTLLPDVESAGGSWWFITAFATGLGLLSGLWIWKMAEAARWGGLKTGEQTWMLDSMVFGERLLALLRLGRAPDRAWTESIPLLPPGLRAAWGSDPWNVDTAKSQEENAKTLREVLLQAGGAYKKSIQASLWDGQPCSERIESVISGLRSETRAYQERELQLLATRALKPLFLLTAPGLLSLLGFALFLSFASAVGGL